MAKYRFLYILLLLGSVALAVGYYSRFTFIIMLSVIAMPLVSFVLLLCTRLFLKIESAPKKVFVHKLQQFDIVVRVKNRFIIPVSPLRITGIFHDEDGTIREDRQLILSVMPFSTSEFSFGGNIRYRGEYLLGYKEAWLYDFLRLFRFKIKLNPDCSVIVSPRRLSLDDNNALCDDDYESTRTTMSFFENTSFSSVRKYTDGDSLRHVHWKLSAKQDSLIVKQMEQNLGSNASILVDITSHFLDDEKDMAATDAVVETALAITQKIISDGRRAINLYRNVKGEAEISAVENKDDYEKLFALYSVVPIFNAELGAVSLLREIGSFFSDNETLFIITPKLSGTDLKKILESGAHRAKNIRIYLTGEKISDSLAEAAVTYDSISIFEISPDDVGISLRNSME